MLLCKMTMKWREEEVSEVSVPREAQPQTLTQDSKSSRWPRDYSPLSTLPPLHRPTAEALLVSLSFQHCAGVFTDLVSRLLLSLPTACGGLLNALG